MILFPLYIVQAGSKFLYRNSEDWMAWPSVVDMPYGHYLVPAWHNFLLLFWSKPLWQYICCVQSDLAGIIGYKVQLFYIARQVRPGPRFIRIYTQSISMTTK